MAASDEMFMQHSLEFVDGFKDLRNLRTQLYSAAEYFESSFGDTDDNQQYATDSCKDYVATAFVRTVDHLGSVADKLTSFLEQKTDEFSRTNIRCSCLEQRLNTLTRMRSLWQHKLMMTETPLHHHHHKRYVFPDRKKKTIACEKSSFSSPYDDDLQQHYYRGNKVVSLNVNRKTVIGLTSSSVPRKSVVVWRSPDVTTKRDYNELDAYAKKSKSFFNALFSTRKSKKGSSAAAY
ncbi:hypothetical protein M569_03744 [Genlisea aurea]|uniref:Uncharacterized protein n=1 Tax=Genlisea aurea TaxID=192259 RepID=S8CW18_9LAMI|nr:hypothetical protein M569_03744 [Genlisea aurea]